MRNILMNKNLNYVGENNRNFLIAFDKAMCDLGYVRLEKGDFVRWGSYIVEYIKPKIKAKTCISKIVFDGENIWFRLYFRNIDKHIKHIENAKNHIKEAFINDEGKCELCHIGGCVKTDGSCRHRKTYVVDGITYEKCDGKVFYFHDFKIENLHDYMSIITEFYPVKNSNNTYNEEE